MFRNLFVFSLLVLAAQGMPMPAEEGTMDSIMNWFSDVGSQIKDVFTPEEETKNTFSEFADKAGDAFSSAGDKLKETGRDIGDSLSGAADKVAEWASRAKDAITVREKSMVKI